MDLSLLNPIRLFRRPAPPAPAQPSYAVRAARFDNQFTTDENRQLWSLSDMASVDSSANFMVRRTLRMRSRYAYHNNPIVMGAANRLGKFVIGTGPKLHLGTPDKKVNSAVESAFQRWADRVELARKLRVSRTARFYNGEAFNLLRTNPQIRGPVKLDVFEIEADQVSSPLFGVFPAQYPDQMFDGLILDPWGNREVYHILRQHPGAFGAFLVMGYEFDTWPAQYVLHDYSRIRPAQQRGIPEVVPALDLFEEMRRYRKSVLAASEAVADYAVTIESEAPADGEAADMAPMDTFDIRRRMATVMPAGWKLSQTKAEQPVTTYEGYMQALMVEASQVLDMPLFIFTGDARLANMSSAYVATASFVKSVVTDRQDYAKLLDQIFDEWIIEARRVPGLIPRELEDDPPHSWRWDRVTTHADPDKVASANNQRLKNGISPSAVFAEEGFDFDEEVTRASQDFGVTEDEYRASYFQSVFAAKGTPPPASLSDDGSTDNAPPGAEAPEES